MGRRGVAHLPFVVRGSRRAPSGTRGREIGKLKGREGLRQGAAIIVRSGDQALEYLHLFGIVGSWFLFPGIADRTSGLERQHGGTRALDHWERGEGHRSLHISRFSWNPPSKGTQNNRASRSQLHWVCFPKKKTETEDSRVKNPALQRCVKEANGGLEFLPLGDVRHLPFWLWVVRLWGVQAGATRASLLLRRSQGKGIERCGNWRVRKTVM
jgi:hypothetical protein